MLMLITYYVCIYIIKRVIKYMGTAGYSHGSVKLKQLSQLWSGEALLTLFFSAWYCYKMWKKIACRRKRKERESSLHCQGSWGWVLYYADSVFADQTERTQQYVVSMSLIGSREYALSSFILLYVFFFLGFYFFFYYQISTARGMNVSDNEREMRVTRVIREMSIVGNM
jgi:hypothetical protein